MSFSPRFLGPCSGGGQHVPSAVDSGEQAFADKVAENLLAEVSDPMMSRTSDVRATEQRCSREGRFNLASAGSSAIASPKCQLTLFLSVEMTPAAYLRGIDCSFRIESCDLMRSCEVPSL
jgi:hypothetical protein